ncbi:MAG TPA: hypothetical protein ENI76_03165 [Ignavibacteria bacterium]|nr:hypothetical protein [Ignavibacteria bacterium]
MADFITQQDADFFFGMEKFPEDEKEYQFPNSGEQLILSFTSTDKHEKFLFDIYRGSIKITKVVYQNRVRKAYVLRRLDCDGAPHPNPEVETVPLPLLEPYNGKEILSPHIHLYVEGFGAKWAVPAELLLPLNGKDIYEIMEDFFRYCNVKKLPRITKTLLI